MQTIIDMIQEAIDREASDIFIIAGLPLTIKAGGGIQNLSEEKMMDAACREMIEKIYEYAGRDIKLVTETGDDDFSFAIRGLSRFRVNAYKQRGSLAAVIRVISFQLPDPQKLGIPPKVLELVKFNQGLVLVTGPAGCGKSTSLACMINRINEERHNHIITLEDPLEYLHRHNKSIVSQREINLDAESFVVALRSALRQSPDVILLGELRDYETIEIAMTAAETGHLILSSLHTVGASTTIDRIVDAFPSNQQRQITLQLSMVLQAIVSQRLVPTKDGKVVAAFEIMTVTPAIRNMIREGKVHQIDNIIGAASEESGMISMDKSLLDLYKKGVIEKQVALDYATNPELLARKL
ncbi:MAG: PilT/PilU family type 4a pilus ATPase [Lachnospiraceae bacterium]